MAKITKPNSQSRSPNKRHSTVSLDSPTALEHKESTKAKKAHANSVRASKARASMACERCKHKKVKCEDYVEGQGCEKCRMNNEICYFHRKEVEIKTSFRQGYVENCERECEHLKELVLRMYNDAAEGHSIKTVEMVPKDGQPNITSLMHAYGVALGEDFLGTYEARDSKLASEGQPMLVHNGKGDIILSRDGAESRQPQSPLPSVEEASHTDAETEHAETTSHASRSPSLGHYTSTNSQPMSRQSSTGSLFSNGSIPKKPSNEDQNMTDVDVTQIKHEQRQYQQGTHVSNQQQQQQRPGSATQNEALAFGGSENWLNLKPDWTSASQFSPSMNNSMQNYNGSFTESYLPSKAQFSRSYIQNNGMQPTSPFSPARSQQAMPFGYTQDVYQVDMQQGFADSISPEDMQLPGDGFFADNFMQGADNGLGFDYLDASVF